MNQLSQNSQPRIKTTDDAAEIARDYVIRFYPLWFTYNQGRSPHARQLVGPDRITPTFQTVVAINDDTLYVSAFPDLTAEPYIITIPETPVTYSILVLDVYGNIIQTNIQTGNPGVYALTRPHLNGPLLPQMHVVPLPVDFPIIILRADKHQGKTNQIREAEKFRTSLLGQTLSNYLKDPSAGAGTILADRSYAIPFKTAADHLIANDPLTYLKQLQTAVSGVQTPPLPPEGRALVERFNDLLAWGEANDALQAGAQTAHKMLIDNYLGHTGKNNWINFTNMGHWGDNFLDRASIAQYIQYGNGYPTAAYFQTFKDANGEALTGKDGHTYKLRFSRDDTPTATRFWSVTAYTPEAIQPIPNPEHKYVVGSYTEGFEPGPDGAYEITISHEPPKGVPTPGWLPVSTRHFNIMLRVYGPTGAALEQTYTPPPIIKV
jgi:hypothetical protein